MERHAKRWVGGQADGMGSQRNTNNKTTVVDKEGNYLSLFSSHSFSVDSMSLLCTSGPHQGLEVQLDREMLVVGRADWCEVSLPNDPRVSRHHCELYLSEHGLRLRDLNSNNGTFVKDVPIFEAPLQESFRVGSSKFVLQPKGETRTVDVRYHDQTGSLVGRSPAMRKLFAMLARLQDSEISVLLRGETGTGKSTVARVLHEQSFRADQPFITVNCGALPPTLIEASLFGYEKGAFTDAKQRHVGFFEQAHGGTLFLDEIGELPLELQPKLLDVLERKRLHRLGGNEEIPVDFRLITATHSNLEGALDNQLFREDLYYRLAVVELEIPPLRERLEDIPLLVDSMIEQLQPNATPIATKSAKLALQDFVWPGNLRQLRNVLERSLLFLEESQLTEDSISFPKQTGPLPTNPPAPTADSETRHDAQGTFKEQLQVYEKRILLRALETHDWDITEVTYHLGMSRASLYSRMRKLGLTRT